MIKILHNNNCSKSRDALEFLDKNGVEFELIDIINDPLSELEIKTLLKKLNLSVHNITRKDEKLYKEKFSEQNFSDDELIKILSEYPTLIQRPILIKDGIAIIGRPLGNIRIFIEE